MRLAENQFVIAPISLIALVSACSILSGASGFLAKDPDTGPVAMTVVIVWVVAEVGQIWCSAAENEQVRRSGAKLLAESEARRIEWFC